MIDIQALVADAYASLFRRHAVKSGEVWCFHDHSDLALCNPEHKCSICLSGEGPRCPRCGAAV